MTRLNWPLAIAGLAAVVLAVRSPSAYALEADDTTAVLEAAVRHAVSGACLKFGCYLEIDGKPPSEALIARIADLASVRPTPPPAPTGEMPPIVISLGSPKALASGARSVKAIKYLLTSSTPHLLDDCVYHLYRVDERWRVDEKKSMCIII